MICVKVKIAGDDDWRCAWFFVNQSCLLQKFEGGRQKYRHFSKRKSFVAGKLEVCSFVCIFHDVGGKSIRKLVRTGNRVVKSTNKANNYESNDNEPKCKKSCSQLLIRQIAISIFKSLKMELACKKRSVISRYLPIFYSTFYMVTSSKQTLNSFGYFGRLNVSRWMRMFRSLHVWYSSFHKKKITRS